MAVEAESAESEGEEPGRWTMDPDISDILERLAAGRRLEATSDAESESESDGSFAVAMDTQHVLDAGLQRRQDRTAAARAAALKSRKAKAAAAALEPPPPKKTKAGAFDVVTSDGRIMKAGSDQVLTEEGAWALERLAMQRRIRGRDCNNRRTQQRQGAAFITEFVLERQPLALLSFCEALESSPAMFGFTVCWDEAVQKLRATFGMNFGSGGTPVIKSACAERTTLMPTSAQVMATLINICRLREVGGTERWSEQQWFTVPVCLEKVSADQMLTAICLNLPLDLEDGDLVKAALGNQLAWFVFGHDRLEGNITVMKYISSLATSLPTNVLLHGEPCGQHQAHIVKTAAIERGGFAAIVYSTSKLTRLKTSLAGLQACIHKLCRTVEVKHVGLPEGQGPFRRMATDIYSTDQDCSELWRWDAKAKKKVPTFLYQDLLWLGEHCRLEQRADGSFRWIFYAAVDRIADEENWSLESVVSHPEAQRHIAIRLWNILFGTAWPVAALSKWVNVVNALKRMALGTGLGMILPNALAMLASEMSLDAERVDRELAAEQARGGGDNLGWLKHCSRILRVSKFWTLPGQPPRLLASLKVVTEIHELAKTLFGHNKENAFGPKRWAHKKQS